MLSGEGNENGEKTTVRLISKIATLHVMHTFFVHFFIVVLRRETTRNFLVTRFTEENVVRVFVHFFFPCP